ncbi:unnamed protein product [Owenia fusiformis]|uniref:Uncharacterized protein n=1 Tax=Owenia fusiformis TaxID=6347 RepID=A0A8J1U067_OWEFU|nr:unnamed protein product [Owenia fusiformis]
MDREHQTCKDVQTKSKGNTAMDNARKKCRMSLKIPKWYQYRGGEDLVIWLHAILDDLKNLDLSKGVKQAVHSDVKGGSWGRAYAKKTLKRWKQVKRSLSLDDAPINDMTNDCKDQENTLDYLFKSHATTDSKRTNTSTKSEKSVHPIGIYKPIVKPSCNKDQNEVFRKEIYVSSKRDTHIVNQNNYSCVSNKEERKIDKVNVCENNIKDHDEVVQNADLPLYNINNAVNDLQHEEHTSSEDDERDEGYSSINRNDSDKLLDILNIDEFSEICERKLNENCNSNADINASPPDCVTYKPPSTSRSKENTDTVVASPTLCRTSKKMYNVTKANASKEMVEVVIKKKEAHVATLRAEMQYLVELADRHEDVEIEVVHKDKPSPQKVTKSKEKSPDIEQSAAFNTNDRTKGEINILINASDVLNPTVSTQTIVDRFGVEHQTLNHQQEVPEYLETETLAKHDTYSVTSHHQSAISSNIKNNPLVDRAADNTEEDTRINEAAYLTQVEECINASDNDFDNDGTSNLKAGEQLETALLQIFAEKRTLQRQARIDNDFSYSMRSYTSEESVDSIQLLDDEQMTPCDNNDALSDDSDTLELIDPDTIDFGDYNKCEGLNDNEPSYDDMYVTERAPLDPRTVLLDTIPEETLPETDT